MKMVIKRNFFLFDSRGLGVGWEGRQGRVGIRGGDGRRRQYPQLPREVGLSGGG